MQEYHRHICGRRYVIAWFVEMGMFTLHKIDISQQY